MAGVRKNVRKLIFTKEHILVSDKDTPDLPKGDIKAPEEPDGPDSRITLKNVDGISYQGHLYLRDLSPPSGYRFIHLRVYAHTAGGGPFSIAGKMYQLLYWDATHRFCGQCGAPLNGIGEEYSKICSSCGLQIFPQIAPAVIIAVLKNKKILLGHNVRFPEGLYSLIAGFMEPGETIEACAKREVYEETGIAVKNIRYFGSQPWPFPHSLMIGLIGEYEGGTITPDGEEILQAEWFTPESFPNLPGAGSISRAIIDWYMKWYEQQTLSEET